MCDVFESLVIETIRICLGKKSNGLSSPLSLFFLFVFRRHLTLVVLSSFSGCCYRWLYCTLAHTTNALSLYLFVVAVTIVVFFLFSSIVATKHLGIVATTVANFFRLLFFPLCVFYRFSFLIRVVFADLPLTIEHQFMHMRKKNN